MLDARKLVTATAHGRSTVCANERWPSKPKESEASHASTIAHSGEVKRVERTAAAMRSSCALRTRTSALRLTRNCWPKPNDRPCSPTTGTLSDRKMRVLRYSETLYGSRRQTGGFGVPSSKIG